MLSARSAALLLRSPLGSRLAAAATTALVRAGLAVILLAAPLPAAVIEVGAVGEVVERWQPGTVFVQGDVGMSAGALDRLGEWVARHPNWTIVLIEQAEGQQYVDADGRTHFHNDAVEHLLGQELFNRTEFSALVDERTGLANGAILYISLDRVARYRRVGYYAAETFDRYGLGESAWPRRLDRLAIQPLRDGRRIADAVRNTIRTIESRLTEKLEAVEAERVGRIERARLAIDAAERRLDRTLEKAAEAAAAQPGVRVFEPDPSSARTSLTRAERSYEQGQFEVAGHYAAEVETWVANAERDMDRFFGAGARLDALGRAIAEAAADGRAVVGVQRSLEELRVDWARGQLPRTAALDQLETEIRAITEFPAWHARLKQEAERLRAESGGAPRPKLIEAENRLDRLGEQLARGEAFPSGRLSAIERDLGRIRGAMSRERAARAQERWTIVGVVVLLTLGVALGLFFAARRIRFVRRRARELFDQWDRLLTEKTVSLWELETRKDALLGSHDRPKFVGETAELARVARQRTAELFLIRSVARKHHDSVRLLLEPEHWVHRATNWIVGHRHRQAIGQLTTALIEFDRETELREVLAEERATPQVHILAADLESAQPIRSSFDDLMLSFNVKAEEALYSLSAIERACQEVYEAIRAGDVLEKRIREQAQWFEDRGRRDAHRRLPGLEPLGDRIFAPIHRAIDVASEEDPVRSTRLANELAERSAPLFELLEAVRTALSERVPRFDRRIDDFAVRGARVRSATSRAGDGGASAARSLAPIDVDPVRVEWIDAAWREEVRQVDAWLATLERVDDRLEATPPPPFTLNFDALEQKVARARTLDEARRSDVPQHIFDAHVSVEALRARIESELGVPRIDAVRESEPTVDRMIEKARSLHGKAGAALAEGALDRAAHDLRLGVRFADGVFETVAATRQALDQHTERVSSIRQRIDDASTRIPEHDAILRELERDFDPEVLRFDREEFDYPGANETIADNIDEASRALAEAPIDVDQAVAAHHGGSILSAAAQLDEVDAELDRVDFRFREIVERRDHVVAAVASNRERRAKLAEATRLERGRLEDRRSRASTRAGLEQLLATEAEATSLESRTPGVPFRARDAIDAWDGELDRMRHRIDHDWQLFAEASRSLASAEERLDELRREARWVTTDGVPDNATIRSACRRALEDLPNELAPVAEAMRRPHEDWRHLDRRSEAVGNEATRLLATIRKQAELGRAALAAVERAHGAVRLMQAWTSPFGVWISGDPGAGRYRSARAALEAGNYDRAWELAEQARHAAESAVEEANRRAQRRKRAAERKRRRAAAARTSLFSTLTSGSRSSSGGLFSGGSGFSSSGFSSGGGSGFSSSSFGGGSSGSGFSSSSW